MNCEECCERFGHVFATLFCTPSEEPCTPIRRPQTPCPDHPGARYISMEVPMKKACHVRPSSVALCRSFAMKCTLAAHQCGRYVDCGTVNTRNCGCECAHLSIFCARLACPLCIHVYSPPFGSSKMTVTVRFSRSFGESPAFTGLSD